VQKAKRLTIDSLKNPDRTLLMGQRELKRIREESSAWCRYKASGYQALTPKSQGTFMELDSICKTYGIFIVPVGELESWLIEYGVDRISNKSRWIGIALLRLREISIDKTKTIGKFMVDIHNYLMS